MTTTTNTKARPLGQNQISVLKALARRQPAVWFHGCGWIWDNYSGTVRILNSLADRGLVDVEAGNRFRLNDAGYRALAHYTVARITRSR